MATTYPAKVLLITENGDIVINKGSSHGVRMRQRFLVYALSEQDIIDPDTNENLGKLEVVRGTGVVIHLQDNMATLESDVRGKPRRRIIREVPPKSPFARSIMDDFRTKTEEEIIEEGDFIGFINPEVGDCAKPI